MKRRNVTVSIEKVAIVAMASVVFWIYLGSLINFHQHHLFGRTLTSQCIVNKREESMLTSSELPSIDSFVWPAISLNQTSKILKLQFTGIFLPDFTPLTVILIGIPASHGLRAPPFTA